jgi:FUN14 family protein
MLIGFALKKVLKILAILFGLFLAGLANLQYLQITDINWNKLQGTSQNAVTFLADATIQISSHISNVAEQLSCYLSICDIRLWYTINRKYGYGICENFDSEASFKCSIHA